MIKQIITLLTAFIIAAPVILQARESDPPERRGGERFTRQQPPSERRHRVHEQTCFRDRAFLEEKLKLDEEQIDHITEINSRHKHELRELINRKKRHQQKLRAVLLADEIDLKEARSLLEQISSVETEIRMQNIVHRVEIEKVLTDEQKERYNLERRKIRQRQN